VERALRVRAVAHPIGRYPQIPLILLTQSRQFVSAEEGARGRAAWVSRRGSGADWERRCGALSYLRVVERETIHRKSQLVELIERLDAAVDRDDARRAALCTAVDELDALERLFAAYDRVRFGPVTRDTHIDAVRERHALS